MTDKIKNILIGLFITSAVTVMVAMVLFLEPHIGDGKKILYVRFANIAGISVGTRVTFAGKPVGEVAEIQELKNARDLPSDESGKVYFYLLVLKTDSSIDVYNCDEVAIRTTGLMGEKSIAILPKIPPKGKVATLITDQVITASSIDPLENTFNQIAKVSHRMETSLDHVDQWFVANSQNLSDSVASLSKVLTHSDSLISSALDTELIPSFRDAAHLLNENLRLVQTSLSDDQILNKIAYLVSNLDRTVESLNLEMPSTLRNMQQISQDLASGIGTLGRLISQDDFYLRLNSLLSKADTLMNDVNHYGLLFQYDKHWQRSRTKKANLLKSLDTPREFRCYFEGEVDSITTSLGRLTELLDYAGQERQKIVENDEFKRQFQNLMRSVQSLSDSLKLYNEGLIADVSKNE
jgi:phospholipid/cholesterol/gamma-HCH transport system substrate-binding protein